ncbi:MAG: DUF2281 domain-containing protein [Cyanothece sp. SIO2G6]|nr:DUF2281 domain-containing protein [Cyanothece sp. SIO2G6]
MAGLEQLHQDIDALPAEAKALLFDFVQLLKRLHLPSKPETPETITSHQSVYDRFEAAGLIGYCDVDEDLSTTYKDKLPDVLTAKYDHH